MYWLLEQSVWKIFQQAQAAGFKPSADQQTRFEARFFDDDDDARSGRVLTVAGDTAEIKIEGVLTNTPNFMAMMFAGGNVTYGEIIGALAKAEQDPEVKKIVLAINSPGGQFDGLFDLINALQKVDKPIDSSIGPEANSAAYAIAAQTRTITATTRATRVGSIGVVASFNVDGERVQITSTDAPNKRPDVTTDAGRAVIREELDAMHEIFVDAIATGRGVTVEKVNEDFGKGATLLAQVAVDRNMIDAVADTKLKVVRTNPATSGNQLETETMNISELRAQHPETYAAAVEVGVTDERDRVSAHITMGEACGDMAIAVAAIGAGDPMSAARQAEYMAAGMNRSDTGDRNDDDDAAAAALASADTDAGADVGGTADQVAAAVEAKLGLDVSQTQAGV